MSAIPGSPRDELELNEALSMALHHSMWLTRIAERIHRLNDKWYRDPATGARLPATNDLVGLKIALIHSELSEMLEGARKNVMDEHLPTRHSEEVEAADVFIRLMDYCGWRQLDIAAAVAEKLRYNMTRKDHTNAARLAAGGKKF